MRWLGGEYISITLCNKNVDKTPKDMKSFTDFETLCTEWRGLFLFIISSMNSYWPSDAYIRRKFKVAIGSNSGLVPIRHETIVLANDNL